MMMINNLLDKRGTTKKIVRIEAIYSLFLIFLDQGMVYLFILIRFKLRVKFKHNRNITNIQLQLIQRRVCKKILF